jgi:hypothetical protein
MPRHAERTLQRACVGSLSVWLAAGCPSESTPPDPIPGYVLTLNPRTIDGTDPLDAGSDVSLVVDHDGDVDVTYLGSTDDTLSLPEIPLLQRGDRVGILVEAPGGQDNAWDPGLTIAYGQITLDEDLPTDGGTLTLDILVVPYGTLPPTGIMGGNTTRVHAGVAMGPGGDVFVFGGADPDRVGGFGVAASNTVFALTDTDGGNVEMDRLDVEMPETSFGIQTTSTSDSYSGSSAVLVDDEDGPRILVSGGRTDYNAPDGNTPSAWLFDPVARDWVMDGDAPLRVQMDVAMSGHRHVVMDNGDVVFYGGLNDDGEVAPSVQIYETGRRRFSEVVTISMSPTVYEPTAASLGPLGAMVCGGTDLPPGTAQDTEPWPATDACYRISLDGDLTSLDPLPVPLAFHAMARLADGRVLLTGGMEDALSPTTQADPGTASTKAYLYDPDADRWSEVGPMANPRGGHELIALPDGGALVVGGTEGVGVIFGRTGDPVPCWERFDPTTETFTGGDCNGIGEGMWPKIATAPGEEAFVLTGLWDDGDAMNSSGSFALSALGLP